METKTIFNLNFLETDKKLELSTQLIQVFFLVHWLAS